MGSVHITQYASGSTITGLLLRYWIQAQSMFQNLPMFMLNRSKIPESTLLHYVCPIFRLIDIPLTSHHCQVALLRCPQDFFKCALSHIQETRQESACGPIGPSNRGTALSRRSARKESGTRTLTVLVASCGIVSQEK